jgi:glycosyltransferase involved in cell wall biosynthesis
MELAVLTHNYPSDDNPSAGIFVVDHIHHLKDQDPSLDIRVHNFPFGEYPMTAAIKKPWKWPKFLFYFAFLPLRVRRAIAGADSILAHWWLPAGIAGAMVKGNRSLQVICHGTDMYLLQKYPSLARAVAGLAGRVDRWQCVSRDLRRILLELYPSIPEDRIFIEPMPVAREFYNMGRERPGDLIVSCGALIQRKRFDVLIRQMRDLPDLRLKIFGEGPERPYLEQVIAENRLEGRVQMPGNVSREALNEAFNEASLFVLLSVDEGYGMVLKEAQAAGCPTMAYSWDGMVDTHLDYPLDPDEPIARRIDRALKEQSNTP